MENEKLVVSIKLKICIAVYTCIVQRISKDIKNVFGISIRLAAVLQQFEE